MKLNQEEKEQELRTEGSAREVREMMCGLKKMTQGALMTVFV